MAVIEHLGQARLANTDTRILAVPAGESWTTMAIHVTNTAAAGRTVTLRHRREGGGTSLGQLLISTRLLAAYTEHRIDAMHGFASGDELSGLTNSSGAMSVNVYGCKAKVVEHLAQEVLQTTERRVLCVPAGQRWTIWHMTACNLTASARGFTLRHRRLGETPGTSQLLMGGRTIAANTEERFTSPVALSEGDELSAWTSTTNGIALNIYGTKEAA